jgi:hypothetical protein
VEVRIRLGDAADVDAAVAVFERSNLARRQGVWPNRAARVEHVRAQLREPGAWLLVATDGPAVVGMASAEALRARDRNAPTNIITIRADAIRRAGVESLVWY